MKGKIIGFESVDYKKKDTGAPVKGVRLIITCRSKKVVGFTAKEEFIGFTNPFYGEILPYLADDVNALLGAEVFIDYFTEERGGRTFTDIVDFQITPASSSEPASEPETKAKAKAV